MGYRTPKCPPNFVHAQTRCLPGRFLSILRGFTTYSQSPCLASNLALPDLTSYFPLNVPSNPGLFAGFLPPFLGAPFFLPLTPLLSLRALRFSSRFFCLFSLPSATFVRRSFHSCLLLSFCFCWRFKLFLSKLTSSNTFSPCARFLAL